MKGWDKAGKHCRMRHVGTHSGALSFTWEVSAPSGGGGTSAEESQPTTGGEHLLWPRQALAGLANWVSCSFAVLPSGTKQT